MAIFNSYVSHYQRVIPSLSCMFHFSWGWGYYEGWVKSTMFVCLLHDPIVLLDGPALCSKVCSPWMIIGCIKFRWTHHIEYWRICHDVFFWGVGLSKFAQTAGMFIHGAGTSMWIGFGTMLQKIGYNSFLSCLTSKISSLLVNSYHYRFVGFELINIPKLYLPNLSRQPYWWNRWVLKKFEILSAHGYYTYPLVI